MKTNVLDNKFSFDSFYQDQLFTALPNPDPILRRLGKNQMVFDAMSYDSHVSGELRAVKAGMLKDGWHLVAGGDGLDDRKALELCQKVMDRKPNRLQRWDDLIWVLSQSIFYGFKILEIQWDNYSGFILPKMIVDRPNNCFAFDNDSQLRLVSVDNLDGIVAPDMRFLVAINEPSTLNPYGKALFSSCFWAYTFKYNGFKFFAKFSEKYALPYIVGRYSENSSDEDKEDLLKAISEILETNAFIIPEGDKVELLEPAAKSSELHLNFINLCNKEISKALTSQTLATETHNSSSYAASEVHRERELSVSQMDRKLIESTMNELMGWITSVNFRFAKPPKFVFGGKVNKV